MMPKPTPKPVLKWAGGKWRVYEQFRHLIPERYNRLIEPFAGGASVFFREWTRGGFEGGAALTDTNPELVNLYTVLRHDPTPVLAKLGDMKEAHETGQADYFYEVRDTWMVDNLTPVERAARILYLNKTCFNGLYRVNKKGKFNVPFGKYAKPNIADESNLRAAHLALRDATVELADFETAAKAARKGDFVYFDPPYDPVSTTSSFTSYSKGEFGRDEQQRLAQTFLDLSSRGVHCVLSNSDTPFIRETYEALRDELPELIIERIEVPRFINSKADKRGAVGELAIASRLPAELSGRSVSLQMKP